MVATSYNPSASGREGQMTVSAAESESSRFGERPFLRKARRGAEDSTPRWPLASTSACTLNTHTHTNTLISGILNVHLRGLGRGIATSKLFFSQMHRGPQKRLLNWRRSSLNAHFTNVETELRAPKTVIKVEG